MRPTVSVVIPLYNKAAYIRRALLSVLAQTLPAHEVIVVDDGSTDGGADIALQVGCGQVRIVSQTHAGVSVARNRGIQLASGSWVALLDADDEWHPEFLERCVDAALRFPQAVAVFTNYQLGVSGRPLLNAVGPEVCLLEDYFSFAVANRGIGMCSSAVMVRRDVLLSVGGFPEGVALGEDLDTWMRVAWSGPVAFVPQVLAIYHSDDTGSASRANVSCEPLPLARTYRVWASEGRIPEQLLDSSLKLLTLQHRWYVRRLLLLGERRRAREAVRSLCKPFPYVWDYLKLWVHALLPQPVDRAATNIIKTIRDLVSNAPEAFR